MRRRTILGGVVVLVAVGVVMAQTRPPDDPDTAVVFDGQSLNLVPAAPDNYPTVLMDGRGEAWANVAISGLPWDELATTAPTRLLSHADDASRTVLIMNGGTGNILNDDTGREIYDQEVAYAAAARAAGFDVVITTTLVAAMPFTPTQDGERRIANRLKLADPDDAFDGVADLAGTDLGRPSSGSIPTGCTGAPVVPASPPTRSRRSSKPRWRPPDPEPRSSTVTNRLGLVGCMHLSLYNLKNLALTPRRAYRRRTNPETDVGMRQLFDDRYYRKPLYAFMNATVRNPKILVEVPIDSTSLVIDVGAFRGEWSERIWEDHQPTIHCFEPAPRACIRLARKFEGNEKIHLHSYGLGGADSSASLSLQGPGASIYDKSPDFDQVEVLIRDVVGVLEELGIDEIDLLKINIEGGEYDLLDRLDEAGWLPRIRLVLVQFHEWHPKAYGRRRTNRRALRRGHEEVWGYPWVWEFWRRVDD